jgi:hypothetical protein
MGTPRPFTVEKLVVGALAGRRDSRKEVLSALEGRFGPSDFQSPPIPFTFTEYYGEEMGPEISRFFFSFRELVDPAKLAGIKLAANELEDAFREGGRRTVNLDPGLLCLSRFVLATTKESSHRIALHSGIYAEITLMFERGSFRPVEWTYPDYRSAQTIACLNHIRGIYREQWKHHRPSFA